MALKFYRPYTSTRRWMSVIDYSSLTEKRPEKRLTKTINKKGGRNSQGRITCRHRGGGNRRIYRLIDFKRDKWGIPAKVASIEYDPNRSAFIALLIYGDGEKRYIIAPETLKVGDTVISSDDADIKPGNALHLHSIPIGTGIYNIELKPENGGKLVRSAGTMAQLIAKDKGYALIRLPSGELRKIHNSCMAVIGQVSNIDYENVSYGKAGKKRWLGIRPTVRGMAMNPVDHPHGGGEGRSKGGNHPSSPTGVPTKGYKTRKNKSTDRFIVKRRK